MAQAAQRGSVGLHTLIFFKDKVVVEDAYIIRVKANGFIVLVPRYGIEGIVYVAEKKKKTSSHFIFNETLQTLRMKDVTFKVFDRVKTKIYVDKSNPHRPQLKLECVDPPLEKILQETPQLMEITTEDNTTTTTNGGPEQEKKKEDKGKEKKKEQESEVKSLKRKERPPSQAETKQAKEEESEDNKMDTSTEAGGTEEKKKKKRNRSRKKKSAGVGSEKQPTTTPPTKSASGKEPSPKKIRADNVCSFLDSIVDK